MFALVVRFDLVDEVAAQSFDALVAATSEGIAEESGTMVYTVHGVEGAPLARVFYEVYRDRAAFEAHESYEHTRRFLVERDRFISGLRVEFLTDAPGKGLP